MGEITIDGLNEDSFRRSIETMLRHGHADRAADKLRGLLEPYARGDRVLPARFLEMTSADIGIAGWSRLGARIGELDRPDHEISAIGVTLVEPERRRPDPEDASRLSPRIETSYFSDEAYPFSEAGRCDLLEGYSLSGCEWEGDCEETDTTLAVQGVDDLYGALVQLESRLMNDDEPDEEQIRAGSLGSCYLLTLIHQAVRDAIRKDGLPRPLCVFAGSSGVYPFFDAPVISSEEYLDNRTVTSVPDPATIMEAVGEEAVALEAAGGAGDYNSLLSIGIRKGKKKPVIMLEPDSERDEPDTAWAPAAPSEPPSEAIVPIDFSRYAAEPEVEPEEDDDLPDLSAFLQPQADPAPDVFEDAASFSEVVEPELASADQEAEWPAAAAPAELPPIDLPELTAPPALQEVWPEESEAEPAAIAYAEPVVSMPPPPPPQPEPPLHRHSLRSRIAETQQPTRSSWTMSALRWLIAAFRRT